MQVNIFCINLNILLEKKKKGNLGLLQLECFEKEKKSLIIQHTDLTVQMLPIKNNKNTRNLKPRNI